MEGDAKDLVGDAGLSFRTGDATDLAAQEAAIRTTSERFGGLHAAFANAGTGLDTPGTENGDPDEWRKLIDLNIMALLYTARASLPELRKTRGHLVLTGSVAGKVHIPGSIYGASKWFVHGYGGNLAEEFREWGARVTVVAPGMVDTPFFDEAKPDKLKPEDIAEAVVYALGANKRANVQEVFVVPSG